MYACLDAILYVCIFVSHTSLGKLTNIYIYICIYIYIYKYLYVHIYMSICMRVYDDMLYVNSYTTHMYVCMTYIHFKIQMSQICSNMT